MGILGNVNSDSKMQIHALLYALHPAPSGTVGGGGGAGGACPLFFGLMIRRMNAATHRSNKSRRIFLLVDRFW